MPLKRKAAAVELIEGAEIPRDLEPLVAKYINAFNRLCKTTEVSREELQRFKLIFQAAKDYAKLFSAYEEIERVKAEIAELKVSVAQLAASKKAESEV
jgi:hypothetical protein